MTNYFKEIPKLLEDNKIHSEWIMKDKYGFSRHIVFELFGVTYIIQIFKNLCTLFVGGLYRNEFYFDDVKTITHSTSSKLSLLFMLKKEETFQIVLKPLEWQFNYLHRETEKLKEETDEN
jgi:hypothetical protein